MKAAQSVARSLGLNSQPPAVPTPFRGKVVNHDTQRQKILPIDPEGTQLEKLLHEVP